MKSVTIYGSCVSRNPFDVAPLQGNVSVAAYLSKTGMISQASDIIVGDYKVPNTDDFLSRMVRLDFEKSGIAYLKRMPGDVILVDLIDERLALLARGNSYFTLTRNFVHADLRDQIGGKVIDPMDPENFPQWVAAFMKIADSIEKAGFSGDRIILHCAWWARQIRGSDGKLRTLPRDTLEKCHRHNLFLKSAYTVFRTRFPSCQMIRCPNELLIADESHKHGPDPYHYIPEYEREFGRQLIEILQGNVADTPRPVHPNAKMLEGTSMYASSIETRNPIVQDYGLLLPYLTHDKEWVAKFRDAGIEIDAGGVPKNMFRWGGPYRYSVTIGHHGLSSLARFILAASDEEKRNIVGVARWLVENQREDGAWPVEYDHNWFPQRCEIIRAPWVSAMGQGLCISFLSRVAAAMDNGAEFELDKEKCLQAARLAIIPYNKSPQEGGCQSLLFDRYPFYEEYPTNPSSFVLNGFIYAILGLYDLYLYDGNTDAKRLYDVGISSLKLALPLYDLGRGTAYDLTHVTGRIFAPNIARPSYHYVHVQLVSALEHIHPGEFSVILQRWERYMKGFGARTN